MVSLLTETASRLRSSLQHARVTDDVTDLLEMAVWLAGIYSAQAPETRESLAAVGIPDSVLNLIDSLGKDDFSDPSVRLIFTLTIQSVLSTYAPDHPAYIQAATDLRRLNYTKEQPTT